MPEFNYEFPEDIEKENYPFYVTHYAEYPIYEPAEGGYYYPGRDAVWSRGFNSEQEAQDFIDEYVENDDEEDWVGFKDGYISKGRYIGEDQQLLVEPKNSYLSNIKGWEPYQ